MIRYAIVAGGVALAAFAMLHPAPHPTEIAVAPATFAPYSSNQPLHRRNARRRRRVRKHRSHRARTRRRHVAFAGTVDLNRAPIEQLAAVPGIGAAIASRIVVIRQIEGRFTSLEQLLDIAGCSDSRLDRAAPYLRL